MLFVVSWLLVVEHAEALLLDGGFVLGPGDGSARKHIDAETCYGIEADSGLAQNGVDADLMLDTPLPGFDRPALLEERTHGEQDHQYPGHNARAQFGHKHARDNESHNAEI